MLETDPLQDLVETLVNLAGDSERQDFLRAHPELRTRATVERLTQEVVASVRVDLKQAEQQANAAVWLAEQVNDDFCRGRSLRASANVAHFKGKQEAAANLYSSALDCFLRIGEELEAAITRSSALQNLVFIGQVKRAFEWASIASDVFKRFGDRLRLARLEMNFANILFRQDRWEEAAKRYESAYKEFRDLGESRDVAVSLRNMAVCHVSLHNFQQAMGFYMEARAYCSKEGLPILVSEIDYNIAYLYYLRGQYTRAIELFQITRKRCEEVGEEYHMALCDLDLTEIFLELNLVEEAVELGQRGFASFDELGMPYEKAKSLANLAIGVNRQGKAFLTLELLGKAREIFIEEQNQIWPPLVDLYEALVLHKAGRPLEASRLAERARKGFTVASLPTKIAICEVLLALLHLESGQHERARETCMSAVTRVQSMDAPALKSQSFYVMGLIEEARGEGERALDAYKEAHENLERLRSHVQIEELKIDLIEDRLLVYQSLVSLILRMGEDSDDSLRKAFEYIEKAKTRSLADLMSFRAHALPPTSTTRSDQAEEVRRIREELNWYYRQIDLQEMRGHDQSREEINQLREVSRQREDHLAQTLGELQTSDREFSSLQEAATIDLDLIRSALEDGTVLVEYYIARGIVYVCVLDKKMLKILPIAIGSRVKDRLRGLQFQLSKFGIGDDYVREFLGVIKEATAVCLGDLYDELFAPIRQYVDCQRLVVVPHGFLHYIPFHALYGDGGYLVDRFSISYAPSASVLYLCCTKGPPARGRPLVLGAANGLADQRGAGSVDEVEVVAQSLPGARIFVGEEATADNLARYGQSSRIVYLRSQMDLRMDNPMFSGIELSGSRMSLFDIFNLRLGSELVILSGCGRGFASGGNGDEVVGLTRGLLYSGSRAAVVSLWESDNGSSCLLLQAFLGLIEAGARRDDSLRHAMREVRDAYPHPYYWSSFVLVGKA